MLSLLVMGVLLGTLGCLGRSPDVRHFMLGTDPSVETGELAPELAVLIGPVRLPSYLERTQIARRVGGGEVELDEFNRWLGGFESNLTTALAARVRSRLGGVRVVGYPSKPPFPIDYSVRIHVDEWIVDETDSLRVSLRWAIESAGRETSPKLSAHEQSLPLDGSSVEALVEAHDAAVLELAREIADQLVAAAGAEGP
jgi:uncharacterized protein